MKFDELVNFFENDFFKKEIEAFRKDFPLKERIFQESPLYTGNYGGNFNIPLLRNVRVENIKNTNKKEKEPYLFGGKLPLDLYSDFSSNIKEYSLLFDNDLAAYVYFLELNDGGMEINSSWNNLEFKGLFREFFWNFLLPKYRYIQSSNNNSRQGADFWIKVCEESKKRGKQYYVVNLEDNIETEVKSCSFLRENFKEIWNNVDREIRLRIYN
jgi:hypothetical protein